MHNAQSCLTRITQIPRNVISQNSSNNLNNCRTNTTTLWFLWDLGDQRDFGDRWDGWDTWDSGTLFEKNFFEKGNKDQFEGVIWSETELMGQKPKKNG